MSTRVISSFIKSFGLGLFCLFVLLTGWACECGSSSGSDHQKSGQPGSSRDAPLALLPGVVQRWHDFNADEINLTDKDLAFLRSALQGNIVIGLMVPQAPGANAPGDLYGEDHFLWLWYRSNNQQRNLKVYFSPDPARAAELEAMFPAEPNTHWQTLVISGTNWLTQVPTQTTTFQNVFASLKYELDFKGSDYCNGCEIKITFCSDTEAPVSQRALLAAKGVRLQQNNAGLTCARPNPTYITLTDSQGGLLPGAVTAAFGMWGGQIYTTTYGTDVTIPYLLQHTSPTTETFTLSPVYSEQGWNYQWQDLNGNPINQFKARPFSKPIWETPHTPNLKVVGAGLPTCTRMMDTIYLTATHVTTATLQATTATRIEVLPDPSTCFIADVAIAQIASSQVISAGEWITFTLTVTNFESTPVKVAITSTLSNAAAIGSFNLPPGCAQNAAVINCAAPVPANKGAIVLKIGLKIAAAFTGQVANRVRVEPIFQIDDRFYDNAAGPVYITVRGSGLVTYKLFAPCIRR